MANTVMTPPELEQREKDRDERLSDGPYLGPDPGLQGESVFLSLIHSIRDTFFAPKLPPLELESTPIPVVDRMIVKRDPVSTGIAVGLHILVILLIFWIIKTRVITVAAVKPVVAVVDPDLPAPKVITPPAAKAMGGGGGAHDIAPVTKGRLPKFDPVPIVPPSAPPKIPPKLAVDPAIDVQPNVKMTNNNMPNLGDPRAPSVGVASLGNGRGGGIGSGNGNGLGPGSGGNFGGGVRQIGGGVSAPILVVQPDPEFSEEARKAKFQGEVLVNLIVDASGRPQRVRVIRPVGMGLDEKALEAVRQYRFKPAMENGKPVTVEMYVDVNFQIF